MIWRIQIIVPLFFLFCLMAVKASANTSSPSWVLEEQQILQPRTKSSLNRILNETANTQQAYIQVLLLNQPSQDLQEVIQKNRMAWHTFHPHMNGLKAALLIINVKTGETRVILNKEREKDIILQNSISRLQSNLFEPMLKKGQVDKAVIEGTIALSTLVADLPSRKKTGLAFFYQWLKTYHLLSILKFMGLLGFLWGGWKAFKRFLPQPSWETAQLGIPLSLEEASLRS